MPAKTERVQTPRRNQIKEYLRARGIPHKISYTNSTTSIFWPTPNPQRRRDLKIICSDTFLNMRELGFIRQVSSHIKKQKAPGKFSAKDVSYFRRRQDIEGGVYYDVCEVDVNQAYWNIALNFGYITEEIYKKAYLVDEDGRPLYRKVARLVALGAAAACKTHYIFDGRTFAPDAEKGENGVEEHEEGRNIFFHIASHLGRLMEEAERKAGFYLFFYWVDAFFIRSDDVYKVKNYFSKHGLTVKVKEMEYLHFFESPEGGPMAEAVEADGTRKTFNFPSRKRKERLIKNFKKDPKKW